MKRLFFLLARWQRWKANVKYSSAEKDQSPSTQHEDVRRQGCRLEAMEESSPMFVFTWLVIQPKRHRDNQLMSPSFYCLILWHHPCTVHTNLVRLCHVQQTMSSNEIPVLTNVVKNGHDRKVSALWSEAISHVSILSLTISSQNAATRAKCLMHSQLHIRITFSNSK